MTRLTAAATIAALVLALGATACGQADDPAADGAGVAPPEVMSDAPALPEVPEVPVPEAAAPELPTPVAPDVAVPDVAEPAAVQIGDVVNVYWAWSIPTIQTGTPERIGAGARPGATPSDAIEALLDGPNALETELGMGTSIPSGAELLGVEVDAGTAIVDLSGAFNSSSGSLDETMRFAQVVFTLTQFDDIDGVSFRLDGVDVVELGSHGLVATAPLDRDDFADVRAFITVERPFPGAVVVSGDRLAGESNTFEATVEWTVTDADGLIVAEGFTTATGGNGTWGRFDTPVTFDDGLTGRGSIIVFESSAEDGSPVNVVEYPVVFGAGLPESR